MLTQCTCRPGEFDVCEYIFFCNQKARSSSMMGCFGPRVTS
uniref:Uncharacterized protein n=1 Tax=Anguilla anguilla TaxID=7936 RepID=A0A0E9VD14_ANGAN